MKLYEYRPAPNPRRVRMFLAEKGLEIETVQIDLAVGGNLAPEFLALNPRGLLPTLQLDDGTCLDETMAICRYFEELHPQPPLMGTDALGKAVIESRTRHMELDGFCNVVDALRNTSPAFTGRVVPGVLDSPPAIPQLAERGFAGIDRFFASLDAYLARNEFVAGADFSNADITAFCVVDFAKWVKRRVPERHGNTQRWYQQVSLRSSAKA